MKKNGFCNFLCTVYIFSNKRQRLKHCRKHLTFLKAIFARNPNIMAVFQLNKSLLDRTQVMLIAHIDLILK